MNLKLDEFILINHNDLHRVNISCGFELSPKSQIDKAIKSLRVSLIQLKRWDSAFYDSLING